MNPPNQKEAKQLFYLKKNGLKNLKNIEVVICPPFSYLSSFKFPVPNFQLGAQNCFWEQSGAFTGEISPLMLKNLECQYVIIGHSERRRILKETDEMINKKLKAVLEAGLKPILCIGETQEERNKGKTETILKNQIEKALKNVPSYKLQVTRFCIAYEPIWAIGTGKPCLLQEALKAKVFISKVLKVLLGKKIAEKIKILYGGSVSSKNGLSYIKEAKMDGLLVGAISLKPKEFIKLITYNL